LVSTDGGQTWQARQSFPPDATWDILLVRGAVGPDTLYLANEDRSAGFRYPTSAIITRVTNGGQTVEQYGTEGLAIEQGTVPNSLGGVLTHLVADAAASSRLYAVITNEYSDDLFAFFQALLALPASLSSDSYTLSLNERGVGGDCRMWYEGNRLDAFTLKVK
jgi:hypothetical protein